MLCTFFCGEIRVDGLREADSLVFHVKNTVIILEEVNTKVSLACVTRRCDLENTVAIAVDHILMF